MVNKYQNSTAMKKTQLLLPVILFVSILCFQSCKTETPKVTGTSCELTASEKSQIITEILLLTDNWAIAHNQMNADKASEFWDNSSDLMFAENGEFFKDWNSIHNYLHDFYASTFLMSLSWTRREIIPLSLNSASLAGRLHIVAHYKSGESFEINSMFTGVFIKKNGKWVLIHGQESFKL
jgi:hypothetical protein